METVQVELWVMVSENGDYVAIDDADLLTERWEASIGDRPDAATATRVVKVTLTVPKPKPVELVGVVGEEVIGGQLRAV